MMCIYRVDIAERIFHHLMKLKYFRILFFIFRKKSSQRILKGNEKSNIRSAVKNVNYTTGTLYGLI